MNLDPNAHPVESTEKSSLQELEESQSRGMWSNPNIREDVDIMSVGHNMRDTSSRKLKKHRKDPYSKRRHIDPKQFTNNLMHTIQSLSHYDSNTLAQTLAPILSTTSFKKQTYLPRPKSTPQPSQHDESFKLDEKFVSALLPKGSEDDNENKSPYEPQPHGNLANTAHEIPGPGLAKPSLENVSPIQDATYSLLKQQLISCLENDAVLLTLQSLEAKQKLIENDVDTRRNELKALHNQKRVDLLNLHRRRMDKQPERRNEIKIRCDKEHRDLESLLRKEMAEFEDQVNQEFDKATYDQQKILQEAGIPGFFPTNDPQQIELQSKILNMLTIMAKDTISRKAATYSQMHVAKQGLHPMGQSYSYLPHL